MAFDIPEELKKLPQKPGVYIMHGRRDEVIYVGKAVKLRNRVKQYFSNSKNKRLKIYSMVPQVTRFEYIVTDTEVEALVLECNLIKEYRPKYNTMLMDDKAYPFISVTSQEDFPRVLYAHQMKKDKSQYFGPYPDAGAAKETVDLVRKLYKIRPCNKRLPEEIGRDRPCLYHHIHQCDAPCQGNISKEEYRERVQQAMRFLNGKTDDVKEDLKQRMQEAAEELRFEEAAALRDLIGSVEKVSERQKMSSGSREDTDVIALACDRNDAIAQVFFVRDGKLIGRDHFYLKIGEDEDRGTVMQSFIQQFYSGTPFIPRELMLSDAIPGSEVLEEWLTSKKGNRVYIRVPQKGSKEKLVELAKRNAAIILFQDRERIKKDAAKTIGAIGEIGSWLGMEAPERIESYDISNISGYQSVGSMVVYENGKPKKADYRKFRIKSVEGANDYASMEEVLTRRFKRGLNEDSGFEKLPDLLLMDGGKGQVNIALRVLDQLGLSVPVAGMVKDDRHRTRGLYFNNKEIPIPVDSEGFHLITRIQDETHRFAIEYHRLLRSKEQVHSILDDIPNVGERRKRDLMKAFPNLDAIRNAEVADLMELPSMNERAARSVYEFFRKPKPADTEEMK
ncbi:MAG: excinuclease ABC subunit UvrC [Eubacteriales bacterium]|nr:excinuclease ABC subunit UvrC [Eubacteriales bacterium]